MFAGALVLGIASSGLAATPSSGTIDPTTTSVSWQGQHYTAGANVANACPSSASDPGNLVCDHFRVTVGVNSAFWNDKVGGALITITWASADNDFDLFVFDSQGNLVDDSAQGSTTFEQVMIPDAVGTYEVRVSPFLVANSGYSGAASFVSNPITAAPGSGPAAYHGVLVSGENPDTAPENTPVKQKKSDVLQLQFVDTGFEAAEPTIGVDKKGAALYAAATFDGILGTAHTTYIRSKDGGLTWQSVQPTIANQLDAHPETLDPYAYVEEGSGRFFAVDLIGDNLVVGLPVGAVLSFSDDQGENWTTSAATIPGLNDHQTIFAGPPPAGNPLLIPLDPRFAEILYYCVNQVSDSWCARSLDGGVSFVQGATPAFLGFDAEAGGNCGGLHGHVATDSAGRVFLPKGHCGFPWIAISENGGDTWERVQISDKIGMPHHEVTVAVDPADNIYAVFWDDKHHLPYLTISRDHGQTWSTPRMIAPPGVREVNFPTIAAGDVGKIAISFPGTTVADRSDPTRPWNSYVVVSTNALSDDPLFVSNIANPAGDPVHRGACTGRCGGMFDFLDVVVSPSDGAVWATAVDTCTAKDGCNTNPKGSPSDMRGIAIKQIAGPVLLGTPTCRGNSHKCR